MTKLSSLDFLGLFEKITSTFSTWAWGYPLLFWLVGGGIFFMLYSGFVPFRYLGHAINVLRGKYDDPNSEGDITHFQALSSALAATVGMGNISGVAVAITIGGPGALFWMWVSALFGTATKFFTCTLAVMYRGRDSQGNLQGGPMYVLTEGLGKNWKPVAVFFSVAGMFGVLPIFQANQLTQIFREVVLIPQNIVTEQAHFMSDFMTGIILVAMVSVVIFGGIQRIADVASKMVPAMVILYSVAVLYIVFSNFEKLPQVISLIFTDAFQGVFYQGEPDSLFGGVLGAMIITGVKRAAFSNEAGIGTAPLAHGAAKTDEPVREGLAAMLGPVIDTIIVCTMTALAILITGAWKTEGSGIGVTLLAFETAIPYFGKYILILCASIFSITTLFTFSYFGAKCLGFIAGAEYQKYYNYFYVSSIILGAVASIQAVISLIDGMYALMAIPNLIAAFILAPTVRRATRNYFERMKNRAHQAK